MRATNRQLLAVTAGDLMSRDPVTLSENTQVCDAVRLLLRRQIGGAPVVNEQGQCVGVFSLVDSLPGRNRGVGGKVGLPITCSFLKPHVTTDGRDAALCTLPFGACPIQAKQTEPDGEPKIVCTQPHCVLIDWQVVDVEKFPRDEIRQFMTKDLVTFGAATPIRDLARAMVDADIHRIIVIDDQRRPIGVVSSTDLLAALAYSRNGH